LSPTTHEKPQHAGRSSLSRTPSSLTDSDASWSDTGDLAEQLGEEDPLQIKLRDSLDDQVFGSKARRGSRVKRVRYSEHHENQGEDDEDERTYAGGINKEDIRIPSPGPRKISRVEKALASIMSGGERQMHGLTGKPLVYVGSIQRYA
jgi:hypothetical protein